MEVENSVSDGSDKVGSSGKKECSDEKNDWRFTTSIECLSYDVLENDLHQENIVSKLVPMKTWRQTEKMTVDNKEYNKCSDVLPDMFKPTTSIIDENTKLVDAVKDIANKPELNPSMNCKSVQTINSDSDNKENESTEIACNLKNKVMALMESRKSLRMESRKTTKCASIVCNKQDIMRVFPRRFFQLPEEQQQRMRSNLGLEDGVDKLCIRCYNRLYWKTWKLQTEKVKNGHFKHKERDSSKKDNSKGKRRVRNISKMYACGWCKFRTDKAKSVMEHHYKEHKNREMDVIRLKSPRSRLPSGIGFKCDSCDYSGRLRHELHLHNDHFHKNSLNRDGITDYESESNYSPVYPYYFYKMTLPSNYFQMQQKYKLRDVKIACRDILKSGLDHLLEVADCEGVSKFCVDSLTEDEFVSMAMKYRKNVSYCDARVDNYVPVNIADMDLKDIETIIRYR